MGLEAQENSRMWLDMTYCADEKCPKHTNCRRFYVGTAKHWRFVNSPRKGDTCDLFWGTTQDSIMEILAN